MSFWQRLLGKNGPAEKPGFSELSQRLASDAAFREQLRTHFRSTIRGYHLTAEQKQVVRDHVEGRVDPRIQGHATRVLNDLLGKYGR
jgi:hypothetical protein